MRFLIRCVFILCIVIISRLVICVRWWGMGIMVLILLLCWLKVCVLLCSFIWKRVIFMVCNCCRILWFGMGVGRLWLG